MAADTKGARGTLRLDTLALVLEKKLENEGPILEVLVAALARGQAHPELWSALHEAATRDDRLAELAFAYEALCDKKVRSLASAVQVEVFLRAAAFFAEVFGDPEGAEGYLRRALALAPSHREAFARLEASLASRQAGLPLADLYVEAASHRPDRHEALALLRRAAEIDEGFAGSDDRSLRIYREILRLDPSDASARKTLEDRFERASRWSDLAKLLEQTLAPAGPPLRASLAPPPPSSPGRTSVEVGPASARRAGETGSASRPSLPPPPSGVAPPPLPWSRDEQRLRERLVELYAERIGEIERALPHVEELLRHDVESEPARRAAERLVGHKALGARAAAALEACYERLGRHADVGLMLKAQIEQLRGPKRADAQKRLAAILADHLGDRAAAVLVLEAALSVDASDDQARARYLDLARTEGRLADAAKVFGRASQATKDPRIRGKLALDLGVVFAELGDVRKARATLAPVVDGADDETALTAARTLVSLLEGAREPRVLGGILERLVALEPDVERRAEAAERLAALCEGELRDPARAIGAWRALLGTSREEPALEALERLCSEQAAPRDAAAVIVRRAERALAAGGDAGEARGRLVAAAKMFAAAPDGRKDAIGTWQRIVERFGPAADADGALSGLYEHERMWSELAQLLADGAVRALPAERPGLLARLGSIKNTRLADGGGAAVAWSEALALDPTDKTSRQGLERLMASGTARLAAARALERAARVAGPPAQLLRTLEVLAELEEDEGARLRAAGEAADVAAQGVGDPDRGLDLAGRVVRAARGLGRAALVDALDRVDRMVGAGAEPARRARLLAAALGDDAVFDEATALLARRAGEAAAAAGDVTTALDLLRRALAFEPGSTELHGRVDDLLREQGSPEERLSLHRAALERTEDKARRRELLLSVGGIQRRDVGDLPAAIATFRELCALDPTDGAARTALLEVLEAAGDRQALADELDAALAACPPGRERTALTARAAELATALGRGPRAVALWTELLADCDDLGDAALEAALSAAKSDRHAGLERAVVERRIAMAITPEEEAEWLERLGDLEERLGNVEGAAAAFRRAAQLAETAGDSAKTTALHERVLAVAPRDRHAAERLLHAHGRAGDWGRVAPVLSLLVDLAETPREAAELVLTFESLAREAHAADAFLVLCERALARGDEGVEPLATELFAARARLLAADDARADEAAAAFRRAAAGAGARAPAILAQLEAFLASHPDRHDDRRWLQRARVAAAADGERAPLLVAWAEQEERLGEAKEASRLWGEVLALEPDHEGALAARARLCAASGDVDAGVGALEALAALRDGPERTAVLVDLASMLLGAGRPDRALDVLEPALGAGAVETPARAVLLRAVHEPAVAARAGALLLAAVDATDDPAVARAVARELLALPSGDDATVELRRQARARAIDRAESPGEALSLALDAVREAPADLPMWDRAEAAARATGDARAVAQAYAWALDEGKGALAREGVAEAVGRRAVELHEEWFDDPDSVVVLLLRTLEAAPRAAWAFERLKLLYNAGERWDELFALYDAALARAEGDAATLALLDEAAHVAKDLAGDAARAADYLYAISEKRPDDAQVSAQLERIYERTGRIRPLVELYGRRLRTATGAEARRLSLRVAGLLLDAVGDFEGALSQIEQLLHAHADDAEALALLERLVTQAPASDAPPPSARGKRGKRPPSPRRRAAALLKARYEADNRPLDVARMLEVELEGVTGIRERAKKLREIVALELSELGDPVRALEHVGMLVALDPTSADHRAELVLLAERTGRHDRLVRILADIAEATDDAALAVALGVEAASVAQRIGDVESAIAVRRRVVARAEQAGDRLASSRALDELFATTERHGEHADLLEQLAELEVEPARRRSALLRSARLSALQLADPQRAARAFRALVSDDPADAEAVDGLVEALDAAGAEDELLTALSARAELAEAADRRDAARADRMRAARVHERRGDLTAAERAWATVVAADPDDEAAVDERLRLLEALGRWDDLAAALGEAATRAQGTRRAALAARLGDVESVHRAHLVVAVTAYEAALEADARHEGARAGLLSIVGTLGTAPVVEPLERAVLALCRAYAETDDWEMTIALLEPRLACAASAADRAEILAQTASLCEHLAGDAQGAFDATLRAFVLAPADPELGGELRRLAELVGRWDAVEATLSTDLDGRDDVPAATLRDLWWDVGLFQRDTRGDPEAAERALSRALARDPESADLLAALADLQRRSRRRPLVDTLVRLAAATGDDLDVLREATTVARDALGDLPLTARVGRELLEAAGRRWLGDTGGATLDAAGVSSFDPREHAAWAIEVVAAAEREAGAGEPERLTELFRRASELPWDPVQRRAYLVRAGEHAAGEARVAVYRQLFDESPSDETVSQRLESLYRAAGRTDDLLALRARQIEASDVAERRAALRYDRALLLLERDAGERSAAGHAPAGREASDLARRELELALGEVPTHPAAVEKLAQLLASRGALRELCTLWEEQALLCGDGSEHGDDAASELWVRAARIAEDDLGDLARAGRDLERAAERQPERLLDLARVRAAAGDSLGAALVLERALDGAVVVEGDARIDLALRAADAFEAAGRLDRACAVLSRGGDDDPAAPAVRERLRRLYRALGAWDALVRLLMGSAGRARDRSERVSLLREAAELSLARGADPVAATAVLEQLVELDADDLDSALALAEARARAGLTAQAIELLSGRLERFGSRKPKERARVHFQLAKVALAGGDRALALGELEIAQKIDPAHAPTLAALARLAREEGQLDRALRTYRALLIVVRRPAGASDDGARGWEAAPPSAVEVLLELSDVAGAQGDAIRRAEFVDSAFEEAQKSVGGLDAAVAWLRARALPDDRIRALELRLAHGGGAELAPLYAELGALHEERGDVGAACDALLAAVALAPADGALHDRCADLARRAQRVGDYVAALERQTEQTVDVDVLCRLGAVLAREVGDDERAAAVYRRAERELPVSDGRLRDIWRALAALYRKLGDRDALVGLLEQRAAAAEAAGAPAAERAEPLYLLAAMQLDAVAGRVDEAVRLLERAHAIDPQPDRVEDALHAALEAGGGADAIAALERFARAEGRPRALVDALVAAVDAGADARLLREAAEVALGLGDDLALSILTRVAEGADDSDGAWALREIARMRRASGDPAGAVDLYEQAARRLAPGAGRDLLLAVARAALDDLGDLQRAARLFEELVAAEPADRAAWEPLVQTYRRLGEAERLVDLLSTTLPLVDEREERARLGLERARLVQRVDPAAAVPLFHEVLEEDPSLVDAAMDLAALLEAQGRRADLTELFTRQLDAAKDREDSAFVVSASQRLAVLLEEAGDESGALDVYHALLDWDPKNAPALRAIVRLGLARDDSMAIGDALDRLIEVEQGEDAARLALELATMKDGHFDPEGAEHALEAGLRACPSSALVRDQLVARYTARGAWHKLAELHAAELPGATAAQRLDALCAAAEVLRDRAGDLAGAARLLDEATLVDPGARDVLLALVDALDALGDVEGSVRALSRALERSPDEAWLLFARARRLEDLGRHREALADLERAHGSKGQYKSELVAALERTLGRLATVAAGDGALAADARAEERLLRLRLVDVLRGAGDLDGARTHLTDLVKRDGKDREALRALATLEEEASRPDAASAALRRLIALEEGAGVVDTALRLCAACERAGRLGDARAALERAAKIAPERADVRRRLEEVYETTGATRELCELLLADARAVSDVAGRFALLVRAGRLLVEVEGGGVAEAQRAAAVLEEARRLVPEDHGATVALADAYSKADRAADARALLVAAAAAHKGRRSKSLSELWRARSRVELADGDLSESLAALAKAFEVDPQNAELAMELGQLAVDLDDGEVATRAFRSVTLMRLAAAGSTEGATPAARALAYYQLGRIAVDQGDKRKARLMVEKAVAEDPALEVARTLLGELRAV